MKTIVIPEYSEEVVHIEAPGCIVNIVPGLHDFHDNRITTVEILPVKMIETQWHISNFPWVSNLTAIVKKKKQPKEITSPGTLLQRAMQVCKDFEALDHKKNTGFGRQIESAKSLRLEIEALLHSLGRL